MQCSQATNWWGRKNKIIPSGQLSSDGSVFTSNCSVVSDKPIDIELVKNAIFNSGVCVWGGKGNNGIPEKKKVQRHEE